MTIPIQTQASHAIKYIMYTKDENGEWQRYLQGRTIQGLMDLFEKKGDENLEVVRVQKLRMSTVVESYPYHTVDPWDDDDIFGLMQDEAAKKLEDQRKRKGNRNV